MPQRRRGFQRTIVSGVIKTREFDRVVSCVVNREILPCRIVPMGERKRPVITAFDCDLSDAAESLGQPIPERAFLREGAHFKARAIRKAACSRKSRSFSVNALSFSLSTSMSPIGFPDSVITGTTISDWVLPNVGKYRGSLWTSATITACFVSKAAPARPCVVGKRG